MILREKIRQEIYEAYQSGIDYNQVPFKYPPMGEPEIRESADAAIQAMRDALLSEAAVEAAAVGIYNGYGEGLYISQDGKERRVEWSELSLLHRSQTRDRARAALTAALAAVAGTDGTEGSDGS